MEVPTIKEESFIDDETNNNKKSVDLDNDTRIKINKLLPINKLPSIKKAKLVAKEPPAEVKKKRIRKKREKPAVKNEHQHRQRPKRPWKESKTFYLPMMPSEQDEREVFMDKEFHCFYCEDLCDEANLECKVCSSVSHLTCLFNRGHLASLNVPLKIEWTCCDCSDLSKILYDEEMRKIISIYDTLDTRKDAYVRFEDYMRAKKKLYEQNFDEMTPELEQEEERKFRLMDSENHGFITWSDFIEFEAADILAKRNKIELSNHLSIKELVVAKRKFMSFDHENLQMISREDARKCYIEYITKLDKKIGPAFGEHIRHCIDSFGFNVNPNDKKNLTKTIWPEFIRKMTILILYDRINPAELRPKRFLPHLRIDSLSVRKEIVEPDEQEQETTVVQKEETRSRTSLILPKLLNTEEKVVEISNGIMDVKELMQPRMADISINQKNQFGSYEFVIRSKEVNSQRMNLPSSLSFNSDSETNAESKEETDVLFEKATTAVGKYNLPKIKTSGGNGGGEFFFSLLNQKKPMPKASLSTDDKSKSLIHPRRKNSRMASGANYFSYNTDFYRNYDKSNYLSQPADMGSILSYKPRMNLLFSKKEILLAAKQSTINQSLPSIDTATTIKASSQKALKYKS